MSGPELPRGRSGGAHLSGDAVLRGPCRLRRADGYRVPVAGRARATRRVPGGTAARRHRRGLPRGRPAPRVQFALGGLGATFAVEGERTDTLDGLPARRLAFVTDDEGVRYRESWAIALEPGDYYVQILLPLKGERRSCRARFERALRSATRSAAYDRTTPPPGFALCRAAGWTLLVPRDLSPPKTYALTSPDQQTSLEITPVGAGAPGAEPTPAEEVARFALSGGTAGPASTVNVSAAKALGTLTSYVVTEVGSTGTLTWAVRSAHLAAAGCGVYILGCSPSGRADQLDAALKRLIASLDVPDGG